MKQVKSRITGNIGELDLDSKEGIFIVTYYDLNTKETVKSYYKSLEDLCEEWEDYEEPKEFWFFDEEGIIRNTKEEYWPEESVVAAKAIGNYFETEEEAEKAVEKLKAWKRLKDKGKFKMCGKEVIKFYSEFKYYFGIEEDLDLLFGGKE